LSQTRDPRSHLEAFLTAPGLLILEQQPEPLQMVQAASLRIGGEILEALGHTMKPELTEKVEGGMGEHVLSYQWK
jgi:hypothetical protein